MPPWRHPTITTAITTATITSTIDVAKLQADRVVVLERGSGPLSARHDGH
jgi:ABC-type arginine transport system ATPase subunit